MPDPTNMTVFSLMKARLSMLGERQKVIAENVASVSTPSCAEGRRPGKIRCDHAAHGEERRRERGGPHHDGGDAGRAYRASGRGQRMPGVQATRTPDSETTLDGNAVVVDRTDDEDRRNPNGFRDNGWPLPGRVWAC